MRAWTISVQSLAAKYAQTTHSKVKTWGQHWLDQHQDLTHGATAASTLNANPLTHALSFERVPVWGVASHTRMSVHCAAQGPDGATGARSMWETGRTHSFAGFRVRVVRADKKGSLHRGGRLHTLSQYRRSRSCTRHVGTGRALCQ
eukprot:1981007-Rhodomonas_salina.4